MLENSGWVAGARGSFGVRAGGERPRPGPMSVSGAHF